MIEYRRNYDKMEESKFYGNPNVTVWEITLKCNLNCMHCGSSAGKTRLDELNTNESLQLCHDLSDIGFKGITLMGGEVFLRKDWPVISREIKDLGLILSIISNGFFNPDKIVPQLVDLDVDCFMIGMDGATPETQDKVRNTKGAYDKAKAFVQAANKANIPVGIITTAHKLNFQELPEIRDFVLDAGIFWQIQQAVPIGRFSKDMLLSKEDYYSLGLFVHTLQKKYAGDKIQFIGNHNLGFNSSIIPDLSPIKWDGCIAGKSILGIQSNGNVKGCLALSDKFVEGNIRERSIKEIWNDPNTFAYNRNFKISDLGENCKDCKYGKECKGGCTTRSDSITGIPHNDLYCFYKIENTLEIK